MPMKRVYKAIITILVILAATACVRTASQAPKAVETTAPIGTEELAFPLPGTADDVMGQLSSFATQTAIAMFGPATTQEAPSTQEVDISGVAASPVVTDTVVTESASSPEATKTPKPTSNFVAKSHQVPNTYTLKKGEHPYCIARRFNVNPATMMQLSGLGGGGSYSAGTVLKIPQSGSFPGDRELKNHPTTYTVQSGDTFNSIACLFGDVWPEDIAEANGMKSGADLKSGQELEIP